MTSREERQSHVERNQKKLYVKTPPEIIQFISNSVDHIIKTEFGQVDGLNAKDIVIIDPFAGRGEFVTGMLNNLVIDETTAKRIHQNELSRINFVELKKNMDRRLGEGQANITNLDTFTDDVWASKQGIGNGHRTTCI